MKKTPLIMSLPRSQMTIFAALGSVAVLGAGATYAARGDMLNCDDVWRYANALVIVLFLLGWSWRTVGSVLLGDVLLALAFALLAWQMHTAPKGSPRFTLAVEILAILVAAYFALEVGAAAYMQRRCGLSSSAQSDDFVPCLFNFSERRSGMRR